MAAEIPEAIRQQLDRDLSSLRERLPRARWVPPENWHLTLKFIGAVWPRLVDDVRRALGEVGMAHAPFQTRLAAVGAFPSERHARVVWAGLDDQDGRIGAIASDLDAVLAEFAKREDRPFSPHLTVARLRIPAPIEGDLRALRNVSSDPFPLDRVVLYRSHLRRPFPIYEPVGTFRLGREWPGH
ncbi:MAG: RNA 2',3'-cyclic phosphodiesterase [Actinomycetota bacterium]|nr:RNA 2',3'-cyclic phosphodiesterase [Actinomycetota bacterium]